MTTPSKPNFDWSLGTWKGSRRKQHEEFHALPFSRKLEIIEATSAQARATLNERRKFGIAYTDPATGQRISDASIREDAP